MQDGEQLTVLNQNIPIMKQDMKKFSKVFSNYF